MGKISKDGKKHSVDAMMMNLSSWLLSDFRALHGVEFLSEFGRNELTSIVKHRVVEVADPVDISQFKAVYQYRSLLKRYRFENDTYTDQELIDMAIAKFRETQDRLHALDIEDISGSFHWILDWAAGYIAKTLGEFDAEEHQKRCRFGKRASIGIPARAACEAARWELPITGSKAQISWFREVIRDDWMVQNYLDSQLDSDPRKGSIYREVDTLKLTLVPKTFKSMRVIMPNTTIGSYMSYGLGEMMRIRLKRAGYDIRTLQERHRILAREASIHGLNVTADLSSASDSISVALVHRLFPSSWIDILDQSRIEKVQLPDGSSIVSKTYCTMGIGYTFPLQTLVFLSLLKGVEAFLFGKRNRRTISVYGDDMIYSCRMHYTVVQFFSSVGFVVNLDKTFDKGNFRESCGGDYYHGVDVRPFQPQNGSAYVSKLAYEAILYKYINGLLMRWSEYEVERTLEFLVKELQRVTSKVKLVPRDFPSDSGIQVEGPSTYEFLSYVDVARPRSLGHGLFRFPYLRLTPEVRKEERHEPYYWVRLRGHDIARDNYVCYSDPRCSTITPFALLIRRATGCGGPRVDLLMFKEDRPAQFVRSLLSGKRLRRLAAFVTVSHTGRYTRQLGTSCFGVRS